MQPNFSAFVRFGAQSVVWQAPVFDDLEFFKCVFRSVCIVVADVLVSASC